ncbi:cell surface A33 antigen-like [Oryzias latipes]|uniref:cell surface A33 antigen-like n=1 Tax=Oryzias latipes TaxID=8090 RepID=UPI000CE2379E|nr:cell surface A33 antigen-like [Oryzias latipes]
MESGVFTFVLLCTVWLNVEALTVSIPQKLYDVPRGGNALIPCTFKTTVQNPRSAVITWSRRPNQPDAEDVVILTYFYPDTSFDLAEGFDPTRFSIGANVQTGQANLLLKSLKFEDSMFYECHVQVRGDTSGNTTATTNVVVWVPPTKPILNVQGKPEYGQNINLTCVSEEASPSPTYKWESYDVQNNLRPLDSKSTVNGGILSLFDVTKETSGIYVCTSTNIGGSASTNFTLSVVPSSMSMNSIAGIIRGVAAFLILPAIIILCCYWRKKKQPEEAYVMGVPNKDPVANDENHHPEREELTGL